MSAGPDAPDRRPATERGRATRQALLDAGEKLFGQEGYHETSVADLTREADVGHGTFYLYFEGKKELFRELIRHLSHELRSTIARAVEDLEDRFEVERVGFETFFRFALEHRDLYTVVHQAAAVDPDLWRWYYRRMGEGYTEGIAGAVEAGQLRPLDPEAVAYCLAGMGHMLGMRWVLWEGEPPPESWMEDFMSFLRHGLAPAGGRGADEGSAPGEADR
jgi:AcrR family transcriptional regulator